MPEAVIITIAAHQSQAANSDVLDSVYFIHAKLRHFYYFSKKFCKFAILIAYCGSIFKKSLKNLNA